MKRFTRPAAAILMGMICLTSAAEDYVAKEGLWELKVTDSGTVTVSHSGKDIFNDVYASATYNVDGNSTSKTVTSQNYGKKPEITQTDVSDEFGFGNIYILTYPGEEVNMKQIFSFYPSFPYMLVQVSLESTNPSTPIQSNSLKAFAVNASSQPLNGSSNKVVWVPFDNDGHVKFEVYNLTNNREVVSHEVGYVFDGESRRGIIAGSVDHDTWKNGVTIKGTNGNRIDKFECLSGMTNTYTRDQLAHGKVKGSTVSSARFFVGIYDDWRTGLNEFGEANTKVAPRAEWTKGNPIGWNSWGVMQQYVNYDGVVETATFIKEQLYDLGFHDNEGKTVISLDSFAEDNISQGNIYKLGTKVFSDGSYKDGLTTKEGTNQILGQYYGPFVIWDWNFGSKVPGSQYSFDDIALKVNGKVYKVTSNGGNAADPTHPGVKDYIKYKLQEYNTNGAKYIKVDFLNNGIIEGDSWYDPAVTTGVQAYNYGMKILYEEAAKYGMYIVESISPIFPYQYAQGRRTCCDRFSRIDESEYVMNAITYGWWTDKLYTVNDPDQLVMRKDAASLFKTIESEGENRARATTGMTTGAFIFGDNFSDKVKDNNNRVVGYPDESKQRALTIMGNKDINEYVRNNTGSFMPVDGHNPSSSNSAEKVFMRKTKEYMYVAVFNWGLFSTSGTVSLSRLGLTGGDVLGVKELWLGGDVTMDSEKLSYSVPAKDARVYRIQLVPSEDEEIEEPGEEENPDEDENPGNQGDNGEGGNQENPDDWGNTGDPGKDDVDKPGSGDKPENPGSGNGESKPDDGEVEKPDEGSTPETPGGGGGTTPDEDDVVKPDEGGSSENPGAGGDSTEDEDETVKPDDGGTPENPGNGGEVEPGEDDEVIPGDEEIERPDEDDNTGSGEEDDPSDDPEEDGNNSISSLEVSPDSIIMTKTGNRQYYIESTVSIDKVNVYSISGSLVISRTPLASETTIDLGNLTAGIYFIEIYSGGIKKQFKIVNQ